MGRGSGTDAEKSFENRPIVTVVVFDWLVVVSVCGWWIQLMNTIIVVGDLFMFGSVCKL